MSDINQVILSGAVGRPAALAATQGGFPLAKFSLKVSRQFKGRDGQQKERYSYIDCSIVGDQADRAARQLAQGVLVLIQGILVEDAWKGQDGKWMHAIRVEARDYALLQAPDTQGPYDFTAGQAAPPAPQPAQMQLQFPSPPLRTMGPQAPRQDDADAALASLNEPPF